MEMVPAPLAPGPLLARHHLVTLPPARKARAAVQHLQVHENCNTDAKLCNGCVPGTINALPSQVIVTGHVGDLLQLAAYLQLHCDAPY